MDVKDETREVSLTGEEEQTHTAEPTEATFVSDDNDEEDVVADASSSPQPLALHMRYETCEAAKQHYLEYALKKGFGIRIDWSRREKTDDHQYLKAYLVCTNAGTSRKKKEDT